MRDGDAEAGGDSGAPAAHAGGKFIREPTGNRFGAGFFVPRILNAAAFDTDQPSPEIE